jgi:hypothetical protein
MQFDRHRCFDVIGSDTGKRYRIHYGIQANVEEYDEKREGKRSWCFLPVGGLPIGDVMLAQKLAIELFERDTLEIANPQTYPTPTT